MSGWVLNLVTSVFENIGIVQEGMETIARPHGIVDQLGGALTHSYGGRNPV